MLFSEGMSGSSLRGEGEGGRVRVRVKEGG